MRGGQLVAALSAESAALATAAESAAVTAALATALTTALAPAALSAAAAPAVAPVIPAVWLGGADVPGLHRQQRALRRLRLGGWLKGPSTLFDDRAPSASLEHIRRLRPLL